MAHIKSLEINRLRGVQKLVISDFSDINLVVGDNNSGKTTFLEAIQLLFSKANIGSIKNVISQRTILAPSKNSFYTSFIKLFNANQNKDQLELNVYAESENERIEVEILGIERSISGDEALKHTSLSKSELTLMKRTSKDVPEMAKLFTGNIVTGIDNKISEAKIAFTSLDNGGGIPISKREVQYLPPFGHLRYDLLKNVVENSEYKKLAVEILRQFDDSIEDICYTKADDGTYLETIITKNNVNMPFSVYGDGIKKILYILNRLFDASDSILLIDEIETGLHKKYFDLLFPVIFALAKKLNVQMFIATHSIEVIDSILRYGGYDKNDNEDPIKVITLKKIDSSDEGSNIVARNVTGKYVFENRKVFEFEVRL